LKLSHRGRFIDIRGGLKFSYPTRKKSVKLIRIFSKAAQMFCIKNMVLGNKQMGSALKLKCYDFKFEFGEKGTT
jgi:hypothetical protein